MVNWNLIRTLDSDQELEDEIAAAIGGATDAVVEEIEAGPGFELNRIIDGKVIRVDDDNVLVDVGFKSEGQIPLYEWDGEDAPNVGDAVNVIIEEVEDLGAWLVHGAELAAGR